MAKEKIGSAGGAHPLVRLWQYAAGHRRKMVWAAIILENGGVAESGTHDELAETGGLYAALWRVQTGDVVPSHLS